jgi:hypothetical protein
VHHGVAGKELAERYVLQHAPAPFPSAFTAEMSCSVVYMAPLPSSTPPPAQRHGDGRGLRHGKADIRELVGPGKDLLGRAVHEYAAAG